MLTGRTRRREGYERDQTTFLTWLISAVVAGFVVQAAFRAIIPGASPEFSGGLTSAAVRSGELWTLLSYPFVHRNLLHLTSLIAALFFLGRELSPLISDRRLLTISVVASTAGGLAWLAGNFNSQASLTGCSPIVWALFAIFVCLFPNRELSFLLFFVIPIRIRPKIAGWIVVCAEIIGAGFFMLGKGHSPLPHTAHLAGLVVGWLYYRYFHDAPWRLPEARPKAESRAPAQSLAAASPVSSVIPETNRGLGSEVDRILDKIGAEGLGALTETERKVLAAARDQIKPR